MNNKLVTGLLVILTASVAFLVVQNFQLNKKIEGLSKTTEDVNITPVFPQPGPANPVGANPFDKPNVDPLANQFLPESAPKPEPTTISFDRILHNFGKIKEGEKVKTVFRFKNTGKKLLIISNATGSCGCTVPKWPQQPVQPGASDEIAVEFNSEGKAGENDKTVTVTANTEPSVNLLTIKATVIPKDK